jgi:hypothetical protein
MLVLAFKYDSTPALHPLFAVKLPNTIPKDIAFSKTNDIYAFGLYDASMYVIDCTLKPVLTEANFIVSLILRGTDGKILSTRKLGGGLM